MRHQLAHAISTFTPDSSSHNTKLEQGKFRRHIADNVYQLMRGSECDQLEVEEIQEAPEENAENIFNNASHVWNHAYYINYRNARPKHAENVWNIVS